MLKYFLLTLLAILPFNFTEILPDSCAEAMQKYNSTDNRVHKIQLAPVNNISSKPFYVFCQLDPNGGAAWTRIQRSGGGEINFNRDWLEYRNGFGELYGEFWLGLERIHAMTHDSLYELRIYLEGFHENKATAIYDHFVVGNENQDYALLSLGKYTDEPAIFDGAGDSLRASVGRKFATHDRVNEDDRKSNPPGKRCTAIHKGGWWFANCGDRYYRY